jgi:hypothetical protein
MSGAMLAKTSYSQSRAKAAPYVLPTPAYSRVTAVVDDPVALDKESLQRNRKLSRLPVGFQLPARYSATCLVASDTEQAECDDYLDLVQHWWSVVHGGWRRVCESRRNHHAKLKIACEAKCMPLPDKLVLPSEPEFPTTAEMQPPECVQRYIDRLMDLPVAARAEQCRSGVGGHPGLVIARKLLLDKFRSEFVDSDVAEDKKRKRAMAAAAAAERAKEETGPNGETLATHDKKTEVQKCGGKGQTIKVVTWAPKTAE